MHDGALDFESVRIDARGLQVTVKIGVFSDFVWKKLVSFMVD